MKLEPQEQQNLWRWAVHNKSFELQQDLSDLWTTFNFMGKDKIYLFDRWTIASQQIRICSLEIDKLKKALSAIDFKPQENE